MHRTRRRAVLRERREQAAARELLRVMRIAIDRSIKRLLDDQPKAYCNPGALYFKAMTGVDSVCQAVSLVEGRQL